MNDFISQYKNLDKMIREEYEQLGLKCLSEVKFNNEHPLSFFTSYLSKIKPISSFHLSKNYDEISFISDDLKYFTALTYLLRPYINSPLKENKTYFQTVEDKRYLSYANILFQSFYNYWDRIGDLIFCFIETSLKEREVYFYTVLQKIDERAKDSEYYLALNKLYTDKLINLFGKRKEIVHYSQLTSDIYTETFINYNDTLKLKQIQKLKDSLPDLFKSNIEYSFQGFELAVKFINHKGMPK
jgi:hypothetical protein